MKARNGTMASNERIVIASHGKPEAAMISIDDLERLDMEDTLAVCEALAEYEAGETISLEQLVAELEDSSDK